MKKRVLIIAPIDSSAYSCAVTLRSLKQKDLDVCGILVRSVSYNRFKSEFRRDGFRLLKKFIQKYLFRDRSFDFSSPIPTARDELINSGYNRWSLKRIAKKEKIPYLKCKILNSETVYTFLKGCNPTISLFTGGGILREQFLELSGKGVVNCHLGILPEFRGMDVIEWPFLVNPKKPKLGITIHFMDKGIDTGPIILKKSLPVEYCRNIHELRIALEGIKIDALMETLELHTKNSIAVSEQFEQDGKQYYVMHNELLAIAKKNAAKFLDK